MLLLPPSGCVLSYKMFRINKAGCFASKRLVPLSWYYLPWPAVAAIQDFRWGPFPASPADATRDHTPGPAAQRKMYLWTFFLLKGGIYTIVICKLPCKVARCSFMKDTLNTLGPVFQNAFCPVANIIFADLPILQNTFFFPFIHCLHGELLYCQFRDDPKFPHIWPQDTMQLFEPALLGSNMFGCNTFPLLCTEAVASGHRRNLKCLSQGSDIVL